MTAEERLSRYQVLKKEIEAREIAILDIQDKKVCSVTSYFVSGSGSRNIHKFDDFMTKEEAQKQKLQELLGEQQEIEAAIDKLEDPMDRAVLTYIYICGYPINLVAKKLHYERHSIPRIRKKALARISVPEGKYVPLCSMRPC